MSGLDSLAGRLDLSVRLQDGVIFCVDTRLQRPLAKVAQLLVGQTPEAALLRIPLLFSLCAGAQQVAAVRALEQAAGWTAAPEVEAGRSLLTELELVRESLLRLVRDWQLPLANEQLKALVTLCRNAGARLQPLAAFRAPSSAPDAQLTDLIGELRAAWCELPADWSYPLHGEQLALAGALPAAFAPEQDLPQLLQQLRNGDTRAEIAGAPRITGPAALAGAQTNAATQINARLAALLQRATHAVAMLDQPSVPPALNGLEAGEGVGLAQTARGWLLQRVCLDDDGRIASWQALAPTDWNFHADGPLRRQLLGVRLGGEGEALLRQLVLSVDPCVAFEVSIAHA